MQRATLALEEAVAEDARLKERERDRQVVFFIEKATQGARVRQLCRFFFFEIVGKGMRCKGRERDRQVVFFNQNAMQGARCGYIDMYISYRDEIGLTFEDISDNRRRCMM